MLKKGFFNNWKRRVVQTGSLALLGEWSFYGIFRCPYAVPYIGCGNCPVVQCPGRSLWMWSWILIIISALFMGRVFCGWVCPGGFVADILGTVSVIRNKISLGFVRFLGYGKYIVLAASLYWFFILNNPRWAVPIRTGEFFKSVGLTFEHAQPIWIYKTIAVLALFSSGIVVSHFWCRFFCPTGGALELFRKVALFRFEMDDNCNDCGQCNKICGPETKPQQDNCTNCGDCYDVCKPEAIYIHSVFQKKEQGELK